MANTNTEYPMLNRYARRFDLEGVHNNTNNPDFSNGMEGLLSSLVADRLVIWSDFSTGQTAKALMEGESYLANQDANLIKTYVPINGSGVIPPSVYSDSIDLVTCPNGITQLDDPISAVWDMLAHTNPDGYVLIAGIQGRPIGLIEPGAGGASGYFESLQHLQNAHDGFEGASIMHYDPSAGVVVMKRTADELMAAPGTLVEPAGGFDFMYQMDAPH